MKETLTLKDPSAASSFDYVVHASRDLRPRQRAGGRVDFVGRHHRVAFSLAAPFVYDKAQGADRASYRAVSQRIQKVAGGYRLRLRVKRSWLRAPGRAFPVTVDPSVFHIENTGDTRIEQSAANLDCYIKDGTSAGTNVCAGSTQLHVGWDGSTQRRSLLRFDVQNSLPKGIHVLDAELGLWLVDDDNGTPVTMNLHRVTRSWTGAASWNKYDGTNNWTAAGGDYDSTVAATNTVGPTLGQWYKWNPRALVQGWIDGSITNNGMLLKEATERSTNNRFFFDSSSTTFSTKPYLDVVYEPQTGQRPYYTLDSQQLNDHMDLGVNVASGNLLVHSSDVNVNGTGMDLGVDRFYNSQLERDTDFGHAGWLFGSGTDVHLRLTSDAAVFYAPSGYEVSFPKSGSSFLPPKGIDATLCQVGVGGCTGESTYALTYNHAQIRNNFDSSGKLVSQRDQNGNTISFGYDTGGHLNLITDTQGRTYSVTTNTSGSVTQITDSSYPGGARTWQYGYDANNQLHTYTDPAGKITTYSYDAGGELHEIDDPRGGSTLITYDANVDERVTKIERVNDVGANKVTTYAYSSPTSPCTSSDFGKTVATDANNNTTTYCYDDQGKVSKVRDGMNNDQSATYSTNSFVQTFTSANNQTSGFNTSVDRNSTSNSVNSITQATGSSTSMSSSYTYNDPDTNHSAFSAFYPDTAKGTQGHTETMGYDNNGNVTSVHDDSSPTNNQTTVGYVSGHPGWIDHVTDANSNTTTYGHDTVGNVTTITRQSIGGSAFGTQPGVTTVAYDSEARPCVVTDGKGQKRAFSYDKLDRVTGIASYATATVSGCAVTGTVTKSVSLTYDDNGNLTQRVDPVGTSTFVYTKLNRLASQAYPTGRTNTYTYDAVGNLATLTDAGGTVTYGYDAANRLTSVADPGGSCTAVPATACTKLKPDGDGSRLSTTYANGNVITNDYDAADRLTCTGTTTTAPPTGTTCAQLMSPLRRFKYTYVDGAGTDTALRQSVTDQANNTTTYTYDNLDRLKTATTKNSGGTITDDYSYTYDPAGNITQKSAKAGGGSTTTTSYRYNKANELCFSVTGTTSNVCGSTPTGAITYSYDANGNQLGASNGRAYSYNVFDQAISLTPPGGSAQAASYLGPNEDELITRGSDNYGNNVLGVGLKVHSDATVSYYTRDNTGTILEERAPSSQKYYYVPDGLGSTVAMTNSSGAVANSYKYDPYGSIVTSSETTAHPNPFRFAGGLYSSSVDLHKFGQRWYDQSLGRWSQQDPVDQTGDLQEGNRYLYGGDDPVNATDPAGLMVASEGSECRGETVPCGGFHANCDRFTGPSQPSYCLVRGYGCPSCVRDDLGVFASYIASQAGAWDGKFSRGQKQHDLQGQGRYGPEGYPAMSRSGR